MPEPSNFPGVALTSRGENNCARFGNCLIPIDVYHSRSDLIPADTKDCNREMMHSLSLNNRWIIASAFILWCGGSGFAADPKILPVQLSKFDLSHEIPTQQQPVAKQLPLRKGDAYSELKSAIWNRQGLAALLSEGVDPNAVNENGEPILFFAIWNEWGVEDLLRAGANPNAKRKSGDTLLYFAIWNRRDRDIELLLSYGAEAHTEINGRTAVEYAQKHCPELVATLNKEFVQRKPTVHPLPTVRRTPDAILGSSNFRPCSGGEAITYSNDGRLIVVGDDQGALRTFDANSGERVGAVWAHDSTVAEIKTIPNSRVLVSCGSSQTKFWDLDTLTEIMRLKRGGRGLAISPDGKWLFNGEQLWQIESADPLVLAAEGRSYPQAGSKVQISWSVFTPDSRYLIFGVQGSYLYIWNLQTDYVRRVGNMRVDRLVKLSWGDLQPYVDIGKADPAQLLMLAFDQYAIVAGQSDALATFEPLISARKLHARSAAISPKGQYLATYDHNSRINRYDAEAGGRLVPLDNGHENSLLAVAASPVDNRVASGGNDKTVRLWDINTGKETGLIQTDTFVYSVRFSPDGNRLAIGDNDGNLYLHDFGLGNTSRQRLGGRITAVEFDSEGELLFVLGSEVVVLEAETGSRIASAPSAEAYQGSLAVSVDRHVVGSALSIFASETFKVPSAWVFRNQKLDACREIFSQEMGHRTMIHAVATSPYGNLVAAESGGVIRLWDLQEQSKLAIEMPGRSSSQLRFSHNGKWLASAEWDGVRVWEIGSGRLLLILNADVYQVPSIDFLRDGRLVSANWDGTVHLWNIPKILASENSP